MSATVQLQNMRMSHGFRTVNLHSCFQSTQTYFKPVHKLVFNFIVLCNIQVPSLCLWPMLRYQGWWDLEGFSEEICIYFSVLEIKCKMKSVCPGGVLAGNSVLQKNAIRNLCSISWVLNVDCLWTVFVLQFPILCTDLKYIKLDSEVILRLICNYEGWNFNSGNYLFTTDTK